MTNPAAFCPSLSTSHRPEHETGGAGDRSVDIHDRSVVHSRGSGRRPGRRRCSIVSSMAKRFIPLSEVCEILDISSAQAYALVRTGDLPAIKVGGRGQWRVETAELEAYIQRMYARTAELVRSGELGDE